MHFNKTETGNMDNIILLGILAFIVIGYFILRRFYRNTPVEDHHDHDTADGVCCGKHTVCDKGYDNSNLYYDDEELDRFKGTVPEEYSDCDIEEFRNVLYTMEENEVEGWVHCLQVRGIELPHEVKDEVLMMLQQKRSGQ